MANESIRIDQLEGRISTFIGIDKTFDVGENSEESSFES